MSEEHFDADLDALWQALVPVALSRVAVLEAFLARPGAEPVSRADAVEAAHRLAGALGSFARPGSAEAARLERLLRTPASDDDPQVALLVRALRAAVERA